MSEIKNAKITETELGYEDHGIMTCWIEIEGFGWGVSYGGYALDNYDKKKDERIGTESGFNAIIQLMQTLEVKNWEDLRGQYVRCELAGWGGKMLKIGHLLKDKWFSFEDYFKKELEG